MADELDPDIPVLGTPEGRERLRQSGVPLDSWVAADWESPAYRAAQLERMRRRDRQARIAYWAIGLIIAGAVIFTAATDDSPPVEADETEFVGVPR